MTLVAGTGSIGKNKVIKVVLSGFASPSGAPTSNFGGGGDVNCTDVEYISIEKPSKAENTSEEIQTNMRTIKDDSATDAWEDWDGLEIVNDEGGVNWKAFVAAQETDATGTVTLSTPSGTIGSWKAKVAKAGGGGGDAASFDTGFTPAIRLLKSLSIGAGTGT